MAGHQKKRKDTISEEEFDEKIDQMMISYAIQRGNYARAFSIAHGEEADRREKQILDLSGLSFDSKDHMTRLEALRKCKTKLEEFRAWCHEYEYGDSYYNSTFVGAKTTYYDIICRLLDQELCLEDYVLPTVLEKINKGIFRTELVKQFDENDKSLVFKALEDLEARNLIKREKISNRVYYTKTNHGE